MFMVNNNNNQAAAPVPGRGRDYVRGALNSLRGFHGFGNLVPSTFQNRNAPPAFQGGMNDAGADGPDIPVQYSVLSSGQPPASPQDNFKNTRGNFARGSRGGRGFSRGGYDRSTFGRGGMNSWNDSARGNFGQGPSQSNNNNNGGQGAFSRDNRGFGTDGSSAFAFGNNFARGGNTAMRGRGNGRGGGSSFLPFENNNRGESGPILAGSRGQFFNASQFGDVKKPQAAEHEPDALVPITEEDKEIFGEDIGNKLAAQKLPRRRAEAGFTPVVRDVDDILKEDEKCADNYAHILKEDDEVKMEGFPINETPEIMKTWNHPKLQSTLLDNIANANYTSPRKIQGYAIPLALNGYDLALQAETGSGKTAAYLIPIVARCIHDKTDKKFSSKPLHPYAIILTPTRELAQQSYEQALKFVKDTEVTVAKAYGEYSVEKNKDELARGCDILIATPGRFADFVARQFILLNEVHVLVLDESDRLLSAGFKGTIDTSLFGSSSMMPTEHQTLFYSATFDIYGLAQANQYMRRKKMVILKNRVTVPSRKCDQEFKIIGKTAKFGAIIDYLRSEFAKVQETHEKISPTLIFCNKQIDCVKVAVGLELKNFPAKSICGLHAQDLREKTLCEFRDGTINILCVTDIFSRGLDLKDVDVVINFEMPQDFETYIHRVGRAGRIRRGKCISFVQPDEDALILSKIKKAMEEAGHVIPQTLIDAVGVYKPPEKAAIGFNLMSDDNQLNDLNDSRNNVSAAKKKEEPEAIVSTENVEKNVPLAGDGDATVASSEIPSTVHSEAKVDVADGSANEVGNNHVEPKVLSPAAKEKTTNEAVGDGENVGSSAATVTSTLQENKNAGGVENDIASSSVASDVQEKVVDANTCTKEPEEEKKVATAVSSAIPTPQENKNVDVENDDAPFIVKDKVKDATTSYERPQEEKKDGVESNDTPPAKVKNDKIDVGVAAPFIVKDKIEDAPNASTARLQEEKKDDVESNDTPSETVKANEIKEDGDRSLGSVIDDKEKPKDAEVSNPEAVTEKTAEDSKAVNKNDDAPPLASIEVSRPAAEENGEKKEDSAPVVAKDNKSEESGVEKMRKSLKELGLGQVAIDAAIVAAVAADADLKKEEEKRKSVLLSNEKEDAKKPSDVQKKDDISATGQSARPSDDANDSDHDDGW